MSCIRNERLSTPPRRRLVRSAVLLAFGVLCCGWMPPAWSQAAERQSVRVALDFNEVDLPVFVRFMSELTGRNFVLDETAKKTAGKVTIFSPTKVSVDQAYNIFLATLEVARLTVLPKGNIMQIVQMAEAPPERSVYVYKLKHAGATETAAVLTNVVAKSQSVPLAAGGARPPIRPVTEFEAPVQVFSDKATNSLIISATRTAYERLLPVIRGLDAPRKQVFVEAVILEVGVDRLRQIGSDPAQAIGLFQVQGNQGTLNAISGLNRVPEEVSSIAQVLIGAGSGGTVPLANTLNIRYFLQLLMSLTDTNILSTPQVLASDNQKAKIVVGENRPFPTGQAQGITGGTLVTIDRKDVGVTLEMTPQVLEDNHVRLEIKQEITAIVESIPQTIGVANASVPVGPTTTKRAMETVAVAQDNQTIVVGGLIRDNVSVIESKIPLLGDIPLLGWLFKSQSKAVSKTTLLVFLTPHVIESPADVQEVNARKALDVERVQAENQITDLTGAKRAVAERLLSNGNGPPANGR